MQNRSHSTDTTLKMKEVILKSEHSGITFQVDVRQISFCGDMGSKQDKQ